MNSISSIMITKGLTIDELCAYVGMGTGLITYEETDLYLDVIIHGHNYLYNKETGHLIYN